MKKKLTILFSTLCICVCMLLCAACSDYSGIPAKYHALLDSALNRAGDNRAELEKALREAPDGMKESMAYLIAYMPDRDLTSLSSDFLLTNVRLAHEARERFPWAKALPDSIFLNEVLPYASLNEEREQNPPRGH